MSNSDDILRVIEKRKLTPVPRWFFLLQRAAVWLLAIISIGLGGVSFAVADYVFFDNDATSLTSLRDSSFADMARSIPYIWLAVLGLFSILAYKGFKRTQRGYKYATLAVVCAAILASIALGLILSAYDFGQVVHKYLLAHTDFYDSLIYSSEDAQD